MVTQRKRLNLNTRNKFNSLRVVIYNIFILLAFRFKVQNNLNVAAAHLKEHLNTTLRLYKAEAFLCSAVEIKIFILFLLHRRSKAFRSELMKVTSCWRTQDLRPRFLFLTVQIQDGFSRTEPSLTAASLLLQVLFHLPEPLWLM